MNVNDRIQKRSALPRETRRFPHVDIRTHTDNDTLLVDIAGYAALTGSPYTVTDFLGEYTEVIEPGAFAKTLAEKDDVRLLFNHDGIPLARTVSGTLDLSEDAAGLLTKATLDSRMSVANDVVIAMSRGDLSEMSFAFRVIKQSWSPDYEQRTIHELKLFDTSIVTYPMNPATSVKLAASDFLLNNLSDDDAEDFLSQYTMKKPPSVTAERLALRRRQMSILDYR